VVAAAGLDLSELRADGWVFDMGAAGQESWYKFYSYLGQFLAVVVFSHTPLLTFG